MKITLVRHTSLNIAPGICYGQTDVEVGTQFYTEAQVVKTKLQGKVFDAIYSSPLKRCTQLATFCGFHTAQIDNRLMEMNFGNWEMKDWKTIADPQLQRWYDNWVIEKCSNGESFTELIKRVNDFYSELKMGNTENVLIFTHAGVIRSFLILEKVINIHNSFDFKLNYADIVEINTSN